VLGLLVRLGWLITWLLGLPWLVLRRLAGRVPQGTYLLVEVDGHLDEAPAPPRPWMSLAPPGRVRPFSLHGLALLVDEAGRDPAVRGLLVVLKSLGAGFATATSFRGVLQNARAKGKQVVVHLPQGGGTKEAYAAAVGDRVMLGPQAVLAPLGVLASARYVRDALDRAGVVPEVHARGRFKTAAERFERSAMSDAQREQVNAMLDAAHAELLRAIAEGRRVDESRARAIVDGAPYVGQEAVDAGLVDDVVYEDEMSYRLAVAGRGPPVRLGGPYLRKRRGLFPDALRSPGLIAVVRVHGTIASAVGLPLARMSIDERIIAAVRLARASSLVRGVILHVDSPGGSALASARIHHELTRLAAEKPLIACMGDVAASGGYYVAAAAHEIVAQPTTVTGSIGVVSARVILDPLLARLGVVTQVLQRGANARLLDPLLPLGDGEKRAIDREIDRLYQGFLEVVAAGRGRAVGEIEPLAQGRVWIGADAHRHGLIDRLGGFEHALEVLRGRIGRGADRLRVVALRPPRRSHPLPSQAERTAAGFVIPMVEAGARALGVDASILALGGERVIAWCSEASALRW
jgi:protease-4